MWMCSHPMFHFTSRSVEHLWRPGERVESFCMTVPKKTRWKCSKFGILLLFNEFALTLLLQMCAEFKLFQDIPKVSKLQIMVFDSCCWESTEKRLCCNGIFTYCLVSERQEIQLSKFKFFRAMFSVEEWNMISHLAAK